MINPSGELSTSAPPTNVATETGTGTTKYAIRKLMRGEDGLMKIVYVDAATGEQLQSLEGYIVYSENEAEKAGIGVTDATGEVPESGIDNKSETTAQKLKREVTDQESDGPHVGGEGSGRGFLDRSSGNNYGYIDTPNWLQAVGFLPVVGPVAKMADRVIGVNNTAANNAARDEIGLDNLGPLRSLGNIFGGRDESTIANVNIGENPYSVGFEALNKKGQTTLTPGEAVRRSGIAGNKLTEMTPKQSRAWEKEFEEEFPGQSRGLFGNIVDSIRGMFDPNRNGITDYSNITSYHDPNLPYLGSDGSETYTRASDIPDSAIPTPASRPSQSGGLGSSDSSGSSSGGSYDAGASSGGDTDSYFSGW